MLLAQLMSGCADNDCRLEYSHPKRSRGGTAVMISPLGQRAMRKLALVSFIILMAAANSWAMGGREDPLVQADRLIEDQKYDEAILYLSEFIKLYQIGRASWRERV